MRIPNKITAGFNGVTGVVKVAAVGIIAAGALLSSTTLASADPYEYPNQRSHHEGPFRIDDYWVKAACNDHRPKECALASYPGSVPGNWRDFLPRYNPDTDHVDLPPNDTPGYSHYLWGSPGSPDIPLP